MCRYQMQSASRPNVVYSSTDVSSQATHFYEARGRLRECPDCGQPHPEPAPPQPRARGSLCAHSDTHSGSDAVSNSGVPRTQVSACNPFCVPVSWLWMLTEVLEQ